MKTLLTLGIVLAFCSGAAHAGAAPCFMGRDIDHGDNPRTHGLLRFDVDGHLLLLDQISIHVA